MTLRHPVPLPIAPADARRGPRRASPRWWIAAPASALLAATAAAAPPPAADGARPQTEARYGLADSTVIERWTLPNGLRVITRHVPLSSAIAITIAFDRGERDDPEGRAGLARLLAKLRYFGATSVEPARTHELLTRTRPAGWDLQVATRSSRLIEVAPLGQFPGVLHQMAARLRGVQITEPELRSAIAAVRKDLVTNYRDSLALALLFRARSLAEGLDEDAIRKRLAGDGIEGLSLREARDLLSRQGTRQAVLSLAGDMTAYPMRRLIENEFGSIPASVTQPAPRRVALRGGQRITPLPGVPHPIGAVGVLAPALHDTLHPEFYAASLRLAGFLFGEMGRPKPPLTARFNYLPFDDPELALFYPELPDLGAGTPRASQVLRGSILEAFMVLMPPDLSLGLHRGVDWMLGGPMTTDLLRQARGGGTVLLTLSSTGATRALWGDETFWLDYRQRFFAAFEPVERADWKDYFIAPDHQVDLTLSPPR